LLSANACLNVELLVAAFEDRSGGVDFDQELLVGGQSGLCLRCSAFIWIRWE